MTRTTSWSRKRRLPRAAVGLLALAAMLAFVLTSCPSNRDGVPGELATAKDETQSAARSAALALDMWTQHGSTRNLTRVQVSDSRDQIVKAYQTVASLTAESSADLNRQALLTRTMTELIATLAMRMPRSGPCPGNRTRRRCARA